MHHCYYYYCDYFSLYMIANIAHMAFAIRHKYRDPFISAACVQMAWISYDYIYMCIIYICARILLLLLHNAYDMEIMYTRSDLGIGIRMTTDSRTYKCLVHTNK